MIYMVFLCIVPMLQPEYGQCLPFSSVYQTPKDCEARLVELRAGPSVEGYYGGPMHERRYLVCKGHQTWTDVQ
jgi:hypothetical protein